MSANDGPSLPWQQLIAEVMRAIDETSKEWATRLSRLLAQVEPWREVASSIGEALGRGARQFIDAYDEGVPSGWQALDAGQMFEVIELMDRTGWCLTTSPPSDQLVQLLVAPDDGARATCLLAAEAQILDDLDRELRASQDQRLTVYSAAVRQCWDAHAGGLFMASQALSANVISALSHGEGPFNLGSLGAARRAFSRLSVEDAGLRELRFTAVSRAVATSLGNWRPGTTVPTLFNRHATSHTLSARQYTQFNSLSGLMLACGWLREVGWVLRVSAHEQGALPAPSES